MHIAEGFLPPVHAAAWTAVAAPFVIHGTRSAARIVRDNPSARLLLGAEGAAETVEADQKAVADRLLASGYAMRAPGLEDALRHAESSARDLASAATRETRAAAQLEDSETRLAEAKG